MRSPTSDARRTPPLPGSAGKQSGVRYCSDLGVQAPDGSMLPQVTCEGIVVQGMDDKGIARMRSRRGNPKEGRRTMYKKFPGKPNFLDQTDRYSPYIFGDESLIGHIMRRSKGALNFRIRPAGISGYTATRNNSWRVRSCRERCTPRRNHRFPLRTAEIFLRKIEFPPIL